MTYENARRAHRPVVAFGALAVSAGLAACGGNECEPESGIMCTIAGTGINGFNGDDLAPLKTDLSLPMFMTEGPSGDLYFADWNNHAVRVIRDGAVETVVGVPGQIGDAPAGPALDARLNHPTHVAFDWDDSMIISAWHNSAVMRYDPATGDLERMCGTRQRDFNGDGLPARETHLDLPVGVALLPDGSHVISDQANERLRRIRPDEIVETIAGNGETDYYGDGGPATEAALHLTISENAQDDPPFGGIDVDDAGNIYLADSSNFVVRRIGTDGIITTIAGTGERGNGADEGDALAVALDRPADVAVDGEGNVYVADTLNSCVRRVTPDGRIATVAGICGERGDIGDDLPATEALLNRPYGVDVGPDGTLYIADTHNHMFRAVYP